MQVTVKTHMTDLPQGSEDGEGSEPKAFGRQDPQEQGGQDVMQKRRQGPSGTLVLAEEVGMAPVNQIRNTGARC